MASPDQIQNTGIYPNEDTQCFEAWVVKGDGGDRVLVSTCSMCVPEDQLRWWEQEVWCRWMPKWGVERRENRVA